MKSRIENAIYLILAALVIGSAIYMASTAVPKAYAGDYHERTQSHEVSYTIIDNTGTPVTGQTPRLQVRRVSDGAILDFSDNSFKFSSWGTRYATMSYNAPAEYYFRVISIDSSRFVSGDYACIVSNDGAGYEDQQVEVINVGTIGDIVRANR